ncbi:MAG: type II toxin-antitoxin system Phd/YefM family antitoxin [Proteobacteria bacterium]|uniref:type II toxin-antitoxin system Phd/YefM family antitoxin n=1 Tax=Ottowia sp. TaxID=1898956 RepID=UPI001DC9672A|nr:type II toxin-antitoxin system Phd/YefM family antitoxin [Ottowia sp.]MBS0403185.1 type II toxin-antitoxin system Phd/YefM family antitoxin [Pseudomonadota bacterium]
MQTITTSQARNEFAQVIESTRRGPVLIQRQKRDVAVIMSADEYQRLMHLNVSEFQRFCDQVGHDAQAAGMNEQVLQELLGDD